MKKEQAISAALHAAGRAPAICTTGYTCRIAQANFPRPENFYMVGSMGLAGAVGCSAGHRSVGGCVTFEIGDLGVQVVPAAGKAAQCVLGCPGPDRPDPRWAADASMPTPAARRPRRCGQVLQQGPHHDHPACPTTA